MIWIGGLIKVRSMTGLACRWCSGKTIRMALQAVYRVVCSGEWKSCSVMVKCSVSFPCRMAGKARGAVIYISIDSIMGFICFRIGVAGDTGEKRIIPGCAMTCRTLIPLPGVRSAIDREVLAVMIKRGWCPSTLCMATCTIQGKLKLRVRRIYRFIIILLMAPRTCIGCIVIVPIVAACALVCDIKVSARKHIIIIVIVHGCRLPSRGCRMTARTLRGETKGSVIWIGGLIKVGGVTSITCRRGVLIPIGMATDALHCSVGSCKWKGC